MTAGDIVDFGADHVVLATGSRWRRDGVGVTGMQVLDLPESLTPDDVFAGATVNGPAVIYDDEHYFMGGAWAEKLAAAGHEVTLVTPMATASYWTAYTDEQGFVQARLLQMGVRLVVSHQVVGSVPGGVRVAWGYTGRVQDLACGTLVLVTGRVPVDDVWKGLAGRPGVVRVGDCLAPSSIADAVYSAHAFARGLGEADTVVRRERAPHR